LAIVTKFGGVVLDSAINIKKAISEVLSFSENIIVVVSASKGVTNWLETIANLSLTDIIKANNKISELLNYQIDIAQELNIFDECEFEFNEYIAKIKDISKGLSIVKELSNRTLDLIVHYGEKFSSIIFTNLIKKISDKSNVYISALDFIITDDNFRYAAPNLLLTKERVDNILIPLTKKYQIIITEGYISRGANGQVTTMGRESSDFTATLIAELCKSREVRIYTNVPGVFTADPNMVEGAKKIESLTYNTAQILAELGAKVIHPRTVAPIIRANIPLTITSIGYVGSLITLNKETNARVIPLITEATLIEFELFTARENVSETFESIYKKVPVLWSNRFRKRLQIATSLQLENFELENNSLKIINIIQGSILSVVASNMLSNKEISIIFSELEDIEIYSYFVSPNNKSLSIFINSLNASNLCVKIHNRFNS
jgi:aspartate kinase